MCQMTAINYQAVIRKSYFSVSLFAGEMIHFPGHDAVPPSDMLIPTTGRSNRYYIPLALQFISENQRVRVHPRD